MKIIFHKLISWSQNHRKGAATTEFVILLPTFLLCCLVIWQLVVAGMAVIDTHAAVRDAVKVASSTGDKEKGEEQGKESFGKSSAYELETLTVKIEDEIAEASAKTKIPILFMKSSPFHYETSSEAPVLVDAMAAGAMMLPPGLGPGGGGELGYPVRAGSPMTSPYGYRVHPVTGVHKLHTGVDFGGGMGAPIFAAGDGIVTRSGPSTGYGNLVVIDHGNGLTTWYAHMYPNQIMVRTGDRVTRGQHIAAIGNSGWSTGPHLHFEVRRNGVPVDPMPYIQ